MELKVALTDSDLFTNARAPLEKKPMDIFSDMTEADLSLLSQITYLKNYSRRDLVYGQSDPGDVIYWLKKGRVKIYKLSPEGKELTLAIHQPVRPLTNSSILVLSTFSVAGLRFWMSFLRNGRNVIIQL